MTSTDSRVLERRMAQLRSTNLVLDPNSTCHHSKVLHPGLPPQAIDRFGNPSTMSLVMLARMARQVAMATKGADGCCFFESDKLREGRLTFMAASQYSINSCAYDAEEKKYPLSVALDVGHVGRTSYSVVTTVTLPSGQVMLTAINQMILIDPSTRRPTPLPDHWRERYGPLCVRGKPLIIPKQSPPDNLCTGDQPRPQHRLTVAWSDTDHNHTNYTSYVRFALDAFYPSLRKGYLGKDFTEADVKSGVSEVKIAYLGESSEGDELHLTLWRPLEEERRTVVCSMEKEGGQPVCQVTLTFHEATGDLS